MNMVSLPRTCAKCGSSMLHYGACACEAVPKSIEATFDNAMREIRTVAIDGAIGVVEECARLGLSYDRCVEHLKNLRPMGR